MIGTKSIAFGKASCFLLILLIFGMANIATALSVSTSADTLYTYINNAESGRIAVRMICPRIPRYPEGAPVVVMVATFFTPTSGFSKDPDVASLGCIAVSYLWPGKDDKRTGIASEGINDYGGPLCLSALRDVIRFALGRLHDVNIKYIGENLPVTPLTDITGLYAFSHPGIAATNVLAFHGEYLQNTAFFVGRENPTIDILSCVEIGHWEGDRAVQNSFYSYPACYSPINIFLDYSQIGWIQNERYPEGRPFFGADTSYILGDRVPTMFGKRYYSVPLTQALRNKGVLDDTTWPADVATVEEAMAHWPARSTAYSYPAIQTKVPNLKVMLVFARNDHVQTALDKPHIHQAYEGFKFGANLWIRLNPDRAYVQALQPIFGGEFPDNDANHEPADWMTINSWAYPDRPGASAIVPLAAIAEMVDRIRFENWQDNLESVLYEPTAVQEQSPSPMMEHVTLTISPNPFNPSTRIGYYLPNSTQVTLKVYDILGREIATLVDAWQAAGFYSVIFDAEKFHHANGIFFCRLQAGTIIRIQQMICLK